MMNLWGSVAVVGTVVFASLPISDRISAQTSCTPLLAIEGSTTQVEKKVSPPAAGVTRSNWNTDFVVPSTQKYSKYEATVIPKDGGEYSIQMNLKYNNNTADKAFDKTVKLEKGKAFTITGTPRAKAIPAQVNMSVGGVPAVGKSYTVSVSGCR